MATRHHSLQMGDLEDTTLLLSQFEEHNHVRIEMRMSMGKLGNRPSLAVTMIAHPPEWQIGEVLPLASVSFLCAALNLKTLAAALTHGLYVLDFKLAQHELGVEDIPRA